MPYLKKEDRNIIFSESKKGRLFTYLSHLELSKLVGTLNYLNFKIVKMWIKQNGKKYFAFAAIIGTFVCCILEIYRRLIAPYEDLKIKENKDVTNFEK